MAVSDVAPTPADLAARLRAARENQSVIVSFPVRVRGPAGVRWYRVTDTEVTAPLAEATAVMRYCVDTVGLERVDEVTGTAGTGEQVLEHTPRPVMPASGP